MMTMVDLGSFADENFDPKAWVNGACMSRHPEDPLDKHLNDLETKLQLISENIASSLEEQSSASLLKVPRASREIIRLRDDASSLRSTVSTILAKLKQAEGSCAESVAALARVDVVKQRMEAAYGTLQDAAGLTQLSASVETVFASGDLARAAETLANMRRCLSVIGEVPEFSNMRRQLEILEDRLEGMVLPKLSDALSQRKVEATQSLHDILVTIGHYSSLENQYTRVRLKPLRRVWEEYDSGKGGLGLNKLSIDEKPDDRQASTLTLTASSDSRTSFVDWLPQFYDEVLISLEQEWKWCSIAFPEKYKTLVPKLLVETMSSISTSFALRIESSYEFFSGAGLPGDGQKTGKLQHTQLGLLITLHNMTGTFSRNVQHLFTLIEAEDLVNVLRGIYSPYEGYKERYGDLEMSLLNNEVMALDFRGAVSRSVGARGAEVSETVRRMEASVPAVALSLESAVERCLNFTGGSEAEALLQTLDEVMRLYIGKLQDMLKSLRAICGVDRVTDGSKRETGTDGLIAKKEVSVLDMVSDEEEWAIVQGVLQTLAVAESLNSRTAVFEATLCATLKRLGERLCLSKLLSIIGQATAFSGKILPALELMVGGAGGGPLSFDMAILRLFDKPDKARRLSNLLEQAKDTGFHALAHTSGRVASFSDSVNDLVYDVLIAKVRARLVNVGTMPVWGAEKEENAFDLPSFSAYASPHVTSMGEYLLTLPQQLEPVMMGGGTGEDNVDDTQFFATEWMFKVAEGATSLYIDQLRGIQFLSDRGAQQLSADIDYLSKVLAALSMQVPPVLATFQACLQVSKEKLTELIKSDSGKHLDSATARLICKMRRVSFD
eukprot:c19884_g1_i1 orf=304-2817(-)